MPQVPFKVRALYEYSSPHEDDLDFSTGQIITVVDAEEEDWYTGEYTDDTGRKQGLFPRNFVEKYEPEIPSRPARPARTKKEEEAPAPPPVDAPTPPVIPQSPSNVPEDPETGETVAAEPENTLSPVTSPIAAPSSVEEKPAPVPSSAPVTARPPPMAEAEKPTSSKPPPPAVSEKPTGNSFKDRIAAFNKQAAAPITPFKPQSNNSNVFVKKPFVAPPPSRNSYVPPPREPPPKVYRREEEPTTEIPPPPAPASTEEPEAPTSEDQPKPTSLKDRIALLQKQQLEAQARQTEAAQKKEKPKRPPKKRIESQEQVEQAPSATDGGIIQPTESAETAVKNSIDLTEDDAAAVRSPSSAVQVPIGSPPLPARELASDTNDADNSDTEDAGLSTGREDNEDQSRSAPRPLSLSQPLASPTIGEAEEKSDDGDAADEEEDVDPEIKRRLELRERMAKMSGGMGMMGMFGAPGGLPGPRKSKPSGDSARTSSGGHDDGSPAARAPPVPLMALPGMSTTKSPEPAEVEESVEHEPEASTPNLASSQARSALEVPDIEDVEEAHDTKTETGSAIPQAHEVPPPLPRDTKPPAPPAGEGPPQSTRTAPPPPSRGAVPMSPGELSDDELSLRESERPLEKDDGTPVTRQPPPIPVIPRRTTTQDSVETPKSPVVYSGSNEKRMSRPPPPPPTSGVTSSPVARAPPPPPPGPPTRRETSDSTRKAVADEQQGSDDSEPEVTEYDGDYDTDIALGDKHKDALKAHGRDSSVDEETTADEAGPKSPTSPPARGPPPLPPTTAPREVPPPLPTQAPKHSRQSSDMPRAAPPPPPVPPPKEFHEEGDEYDPYRYNASQPPPIPRSVPPPMPEIKTSVEEEEEDDSDDMYEASPVSQRAPPPPPAMTRAAPPPPPPTERAVPPPPQAQAQPPAAQSPIGPPPHVRESLDVPRPSHLGRRSMDQSRPSTDHGFMAHDIDVAPSTFWWTQQGSPPPSLKSRKDVLYEVDSNTTQRGGKASTTTDVYVLYLDYSQTTVSVTFDPANPADYKVEQRHDRPPPPLRQDQLEAASSGFGSRIASAVESKQNTIVGDGTPHGLVSELISSIPTALKPIGTRAYGALVYANLANASFQQFDEIRAGDIVTFRNARFQGHRGTMHQKYNIDLTKSGGDHVGVVVDWDGTKKKVRCWEQGRESKKVKVESFKLGDLRSGECRVWRVMSRKWVGWDS